MSRISLLNRNLYTVLAAAIGVLILLSGCSDVAGSPPVTPQTIATPSPTTTPATSVPVSEFTDRFDRTIPLEEAIAVLSLGVREALQDTNWGIPDPESQKCVAINPEWASWTLWPSQRRDGSIPKELLDGLLSNLERNLPMPVYASEFETAADPCPRSYTHHITIETFTLGGLDKGKLTVKVRAQFTPYAGGSDWEYTFARENGRWVLTNTRARGIA